jgi:hypothetical protein
LNQDFIVVKLEWKGQHCLLLTGISYHDCLALHLVSGVAEEREELEKTENTGPAKIGIA